MSCKMPDMKARPKSTPTDIDSEQEATLAAAFQEALEFPTKDRRVIERMCNDVHKMFGVERMIWPCRPKTAATSARVYITMIEEKLIEKLDGIEDGSPEEEAILDQCIEIVDKVLK